MKPKSRIGRLIPPIIGVIAGIVWWHISRHPIQLTADSTELLSKRWFSLSVYFGILFGLLLVTLLGIFWRRLNRGTIFFTLLNIGTAWGLVTMYFVFSDPSIQADLAKLGIGGLKWFLLIGGITWSVVSFCVFGRTIDASHRRK